MTYKICKNCGSKVDTKANFCPVCKSQAFRLTGELTVPDNSLKHRLFYWNYDGHYMIAKTKIFTMFVLVISVLTIFVSPFPAGMFAITIIITVISFLVCYLLHKIISYPSTNQLESSDYGLMSDFVNLLTNWQDRKTGYFRLSKTKVITLLIFIAFVILGMSLSGIPLVSVIFAAIFTIPAFGVGTLIHKLTNDDPGVKKVKAPQKPKEVKKQKEIEKPKEVKIRTPEKTEIDEDLLVYKNEIESLSSQFDAKQKAARDLIEKRFEPPQLTYTRFITSVDKASELFKRQSESAMNIIELASDDTPRIRSELESKIDILKTIISKLDALTNELVLSIDESSEDDVDGVIDDMDNLIRSVDDYK